MPEPTLPNLPVRKYVVTFTVGDRDSRAHSVTREWRTDDVYMTFPILYHEMLHEMQAKIPDSQTPSGMQGKDVITFSLTCVD